MKIFIELPSWLGDTVMATPAIENAINFYNEPDVTIIGSSISIQVFKDHPNVNHLFVLEKNYFQLYKSIYNFDKYDVFFSFRRSFRSKFLKFFISAKSKYQFDYQKFSGHQVEKYNNFINESVNINSIASKLVLHSEKNIKNTKKKLLGINPGANYGSAKRWHPKKFAEVATELSNSYDLVIFGGPQDKNIANDIENYLKLSGVNNYQNLAGKTSIKDLMYQIQQLNLLITGDSGPMHIAAAFQVPTIAIFGPTNPQETSQWMNKKNLIVKKNLECQPCMKRTCPLAHNNCMKLISVKDILEAKDKLIEIS